LHAESKELQRQRLTAVSRLYFRRLDVAA